MICARCAARLGRRRSSETPRVQSAPPLPRKRGDSQSQPLLIPPRVAAGTNMGGGAKRSFTPRASARAPFTPCCHEAQGTPLHAARAAARWRIADARLSAITSPSIPTDRKLNLFGPCWRECLAPEARLAMFRPITFSPASCFALVFHAAQTFSPASNLGLLDLQNINYKLHHGLYYGLTPINYAFTEFLPLAKSTPFAPQPGSPPHQ